MDITPSGSVPPRMAAKRVGKDLRLVLAEVAQPDTVVVNDSTAGLDDQTILMPGEKAALAEGAAPASQEVKSLAVARDAAAWLGTLTEVQVGAGVAAVAFVRSWPNPTPPPAAGPSGDTTADEGSIATLVKSDAAVGNAEKTAVSFTVAGLDADATGVVTFTNGAQSVTANVLANGTQTVDLSSLADGAVTSSLVITDTTGNTVTRAGSSFILDTTAPATPVINAVATDNIINAAEATAGFALTGTGEVGATVVASFSSGRTLAGGNSVVVGAGGTWSLAVSAADVTAFGQGAETVTVNQTDAAGNVNAVAATRAITVDTVVPTPTLTSVGNLLTTGSASVSSTELGTAYLVASTATVTSVAEISALAD
ncbi:MAG: hypothetical protein ACOVOX_02810, partial [Burkholderiaceae bacterium]